MKGSHGTVGDHTDHDKNQCDDSRKYREGAFDRQALEFLHDEFTLENTVRENDESKATRLARDKLFFHLRQNIAGPREALDQGLQKLAVETQLARVR